MAKDSGDLSDTSREFLGEAWFDPIEAVIRDRVRGSSRILWRRNWTARSGARAISVLGKRMWRAEQPAIGMGVEHANCLVRSAQ